MPDLASEVLWIEFAGSPYRVLTRKRDRELDYRLVRAPWADSDSRIAVGYQCLWHDAAIHWFRRYGDELWKFGGRE